MECFASFLGDAITDGSLKFSAEREHAAKHFAERSEIIIGDPFAQPHQLLVKNRLRVQCAYEVFGRNTGLAIMKFDDDSREPLLAERDEHAASHNWMNVFR